MPETPHRELSVIIPARNEEWLQRTVDDVLKHSSDLTEVIVILDGEWPVEPLRDNERLQLIHHATPHGQRAATNEGARLSQAEFIMKLDAHCAVAPGFDVELIETGRKLGHSVTQIPGQYNLHVFDWVCKRPDCDWTKYQGPTPKQCDKCGGEVEKKVRWRRRRNRYTTAWRFDKDLHFQYWHEFEKTPEGKKELSETMSCLGACFFMSRERYFQIGGMDEGHGSWGQMGTELGCKSWLSGGRMLTNKRTWFAHMFRTQGGDFSFPYELRGRDVGKARKYSQDIWLNNRWSGQIRKLPWLIDHFSAICPLPEWSDSAARKEESNEVVAPPSESEGLKSGEGGETAQDKAPAVVVHADGGGGSPSKGVIYYSDCQPDPAILDATRRQLHKVRNGFSAVAVTLKPLPDADSFDKAIVLEEERGVLTMFKQILRGLEESDADVVFMCEHDVLYHPSHFEFVPPRKDVYYYNENTWKLDAYSGHALFYYTKQTSGLCAYRDLLVQHYRKRVAYVEENGYRRSLGYEPGNHPPPRGLDDFRSERWMSKYPNVDIRHGHNLTRNRWKQEQFRDKSTCLGWMEAEEIPGWGRTKDRFPEWLAEVTGG